jgi:hypothetical protein
LWSDEAITVARSSTAGIFYLHFGSLVEFEISIPREEIRVHAAADGITPETIRHLIFDQILPRIIAHRGQLVLHASAVQAPAGSIIFAGRSGQGKSTLAASLHSSGFALTGDDAIIVQDDAGIMRCQAVYRSLRLFGDSLSSVFGSAPAVSPVAQYTSKQNVLNLDEASYLQDALPVVAIFVLETPEGSEIGVRRLGALDACMTLIEHSFWLDPADLGQTQRRMHQASALAGSAPTFSLSYRRDYSELPRLHETILSTIASCEKDSPRLGQL